MSIAASRKAAVSGNGLARGPVRSRVHQLDEEPSPASLAVASPSTSLDTAIGVLDAIDHHLDVVVVVLLDVNSALGTDPVAGGVRVSGYVGQFPAVDGYGAHRRRDIGVKGWRYRAFVESPC